MTGDPVGAGSVGAASFRAASFSAALWAGAADVRRGIEQHVFVRGLLDGTLPRRAFDAYVAQDVHYLSGYAVALQACAAQAGGSAARTFWTAAARDTVLIEQSLHERYLVGRSLPDRSPACAAYVSFLLEAARAGSAPVLAAAVLPCFWIFSDIGRRCAGTDLTVHPFADWVDAYRDPRFAAATEQARSVVDDFAADGTPAVRAGMQDVFRRACGYELALFDDARAGALDAG